MSEPLDMIRVAKIARGLEAIGLVGDSDQVRALITEVQSLRAQAQSASEQRAAAVKVVAEKWQTGAWADVLQPYYSGMALPQTRIGVAQAVTEWLRDQIEANNKGASRR